MVLATSGGISSPPARSASSRPRPIGSLPASTPCLAMIRNSSRCRSDTAPSGLPPVVLRADDDDGEVSPRAQLAQVRQPLPDALHVLPRISLEALEALAHVQHRVLVGGFGTAKLLPRHRRRNRRARARASGIG